MLSSLLIDLYSFSNELISQHNVIGFRGPLHIYDGKLLNIYNPNEISWGRDIEKMEGERRFAFIPVALPHCISLPLPPCLPHSLSLCLSLSLSALSFFLTYHISAPCGPTGHHIWVCSWIHSHSCVADIFGSVLFSRCHLNNISLSTGELTSKHSKIVDFSVKVWRCRQSAVKGCMSGPEEGCSPLCLRCSVTCRFKRPIDPWANTSPLQSALSTVQLSLRPH